MKKSSALVAVMAVAAVAHANVERLAAPPRPAQKVIDETRAAIDVHDFERLARLMAPRFVYGKHRLRPAQLVEDWRKDSVDLDGLGAALLDCNARSATLVACPIRRREGLMGAELRFERRGRRWLWVAWMP